MTQPSRRRATLRLSSQASLLAILALSVSPPAAAQEATPGSPGVPWDDGAIAAQVDPSLLNARLRTWEYALVSADGRTLQVYFWNGLPDCYGLADVQVSQADGETRILLWTGEVPGAEVCVDVAQLYRVSVALDERVLSGGLLFDLPSG